jgi:hypothetical protein
MVKTRVTRAEVVEHDSDARTHRVMKSDLAAAKQKGATRVTW